ncbi:MAG: hypothetical protein Ct9H300mP14_02600 [Gammaproteobacteria bacterium]|nr:MAG: hypothetical protein Ct9H300mP14_02600 [Gammaproteobacteria bacterium]
MFRCHWTTCSQSPAWLEITPGVLIFGLALSVALMMCAATVIARILQKQRWIAYAGLAIILYVALTMIWSEVGEIPEIFTHYISRENL